MNCPNCMQPSSEEDVFCKSCGTRLKSDVDSLSQNSDLSKLNSLDNLLLIHSALKGYFNFSFQDMNGNNVALTQGQMGIPLKFVVLDTQGSTIFSIGGVRARGLLYNHTILDSQGNLLATLKPKSGIGKKFEVDVTGMNALLLKTDLKGTGFELLMSDGSLIARGHRNLMVMLKERVEITITSGTPVDRRVILGSLLLLIASTVY